VTSFQLTDAERERADRIDELVVRGDVGELITSLGDASWTVRRAAVAGLASLGDDAVPALCAWLREARTSEAAIAAAVDALVASRGTSAVAQVSELLGDERPAVAADAAQILGRRRSTGAVPVLQHAVAHENDNVALAAIEALGSIGGASGIETLIAATQTENFFRVFAAMQVLARTDDPRAIEPISLLLANRSFRDDAVRALGNTGSAQAIAALASLLDAGDRSDTHLVACALGDLIVRAEWNGSADRVVDVLRGSLRGSIGRFAALLPDSNDEDATRILVVLGRLGGTAELRALLDLVEDTPLPALVLDAIARIVKRHDDALAGVLVAAPSRVRAALLPIVASVRCAPVVRDMLTDEDEEVRALACDAIARLGDTSAVPQLFRALDDPRPRVAIAATAAIHSLGAAETEARAIEVLRTGSRNARRHALRIISYMGFASALPDVRAAIDDADPRISELAIVTLGSIDDPRVFELLRDLLARTRIDGVRAAAARALAQHGGSAAAALLEASLDDELAWVRYYACQGLGKLGRAEATRTLVEKLHDASPHVRLAAIEALSIIESPVAWQAVIGAASSTDPDQVRAALLGIGLSRREAALPVLLAAAQSSDVATRVVALSGLAKHTDRAALDCLVAAALSAEAEVRDAAISLISERADRAAADALIEIVARSEDPQHPAHAALSRPSFARIAVIAARCETADERLATALTAALARMHDAAATAALFSLLEKPNPICRRVAATTLIRIGAPVARDVVSRMSREDPDPAVRRVCAAANEGNR
jgi:HEAT repeat protein